jgi:hypothetical protein
MKVDVLEQEMGKSNGNLRGCREVINRVWEIGDIRAGENGR